MQRHFGDQGEIHVLAGDGRASGDEAGVTAHQLHQRDAVVDAVRFGVGAVQDLGRFLDCRQVAEAARDEGHVVINGLGDADHGQGMAAPPGFLEQVVAAALGAVAAEGEQDIHAAPDQVVHGNPDVHRAARGPQHGAAVLMNVVDELRRQHERLLAARRVEALVAVAKTEDFLHAVAVMKFQKQGTDHVVQPRAQSAAGDDASAGLLGIEEQLRAWASEFELEFLLFRRVGVADEAGRHAGLVADCAPLGGREAGFAQSGDVHE